MTVKELVDELLKFDENTEVVISTGDQYVQALEASRINLERRTGINRGFGTKIAVVIEGR
jgi:hypothetical protein